MSKLAVIFDERFNLHKPSFEHPENPSRLNSVMSYLNKKLFFNQADLITPPEATNEQILAVHTTEHMENLEKAVAEKLEKVDPDTYINSNSLLSAKLAAGSVIHAVDFVTSGKYKYVFCMVRPPGHHAESRKAMGFCLFNNVAIGAKYALDKKNKKRIAVVDFDVHHGNGTQEIFYNSGDVLVINLHQHPLYPGTGAKGEMGSGEGKGYTINYPLPAGTGHSEYIKIINEIVSGALEGYKPEILFISSGFDAHKDDPLAQMNLSEGDFGEMTAILKEFADRHNIPIVSVLEGGYNLEVLPASIYSHLEVLNS